MAKQTVNFNLNKDDQTDFYDVTKVNENTDKIDTILGNTAKFETAGGTGTSIALTGIVFEDGNSKTFIVSAGNNSADTTINGKNLYKPGTTVYPKLVLGKAVTVWYDTIGDCFFINNSGDADTVNGHTVERNVPADAKFTDTNTIYTHPNDANTRHVTDVEKASWNGKAPGSHTHPASQVTSGTLPVGVLATNSTDYATSRVRNASFGTTVPTTIANGEIYFMYE